MALEKTLIIVKHDGVIRGLIGEITRRFENVGMKIIAMKMIWADENLASNHYVVSDEWAANVFKKSKEGAEKRGKQFPHKDAKEFASYIQSLNKNFLKEGPVVAIVFEGHHAVEIGRKIVGSTEPKQAMPGTIRGDFMHDSYEVADEKKRNVRNLIHASDSVKEAEREIALWFKKNEIHSYKREHFEKHHS